jgi:hypothetical protein
MWGVWRAKAFSSVQDVGKLSVKTLATGNEDCRLLGGVIGSLLLYKQRIRQNGHATTKETSELSLEMDKRLLIAMAKTLSET